jgi:hypothetical protein
VSQVAINADEQSSFRVNAREPQYSRRRGFGPSVPVSLTHAKVARETAEPKPAPPAIAPPTIAKPPSPVGRLLATYDDVIDAFRARADELELSRLEIDHLSGLAQGHSSHLLAKKYTQRLGPVSLLLMLDTLGLRLLVVEDPYLTARTLKRRTPRCQSHLRVTRKIKEPQSC